MKRLRQRLGRLVVVALAVAVAPVLHTSTAIATPVDQARARVEQLVDELERLEEQSDILAEDYVTAIDEKNQLDQQVADAEARVAAKEAEVAELRGSLEDMAVEAYMNAGTNGFGPLFADTTEINDDLQRDQLSRVALSAGTATTDELDQLVSDLDEERQALEQMRREAIQKAADVKAAKAATDETKAQYLEARAEAKTELQQELVAEEERRARESYERMQREAEEARQRAEQPEIPTPDVDTPANPPPDDDGDSPDPVDPGPVDPGPSDPGPTDPGPTDPGPTDPPPSSGRAGTAIAAAESQLGVPYAYAKAIPGVAFDCSGLTSWSWGQAGVYLPHQSRAQYGMLPHVSQSQAQPGDLVFYYSPISHVSIYLGGGQAIHAPNSGSVVSYTTVNWGNVTGVGRPG